MDDILFGKQQRKYIENRDKPVDLSNGLRFRQFPWFQTLFKVYQSFEGEINDTFTRVRLRTLISEVLNQSRAKRLIYDYYVVCDETNNPPSVIQDNNLICNIMWTFPPRRYTLQLDNKLHLDPAESPSTMYTFALRLEVAERFTKKLHDLGINCSLIPNDEDDLCHDPWYGTALFPKKMRFICHLKNGKVIKLPDIVSINQSPEDLEWSINATLPRIIEAIKFHDR